MAPSTTSTPPNSTATPTDAYAKDPSPTDALAARTAELYRMLAAAQADATAQVDALKARTGASLEGLYAHLSAHAPAHPLLARLIPEVRAAVDLYRAGAYPQAQQYADLVDGHIAALHELEPAIPART